MSNLLNNLVDDRLALIRDGMRSSTECDTDTAGYKELFDLLNKYLAPEDVSNNFKPNDLSSGDFLRGVLQAYKRTALDQAYEAFVDEKLSDNERECLERYLSGEEAGEVAKDFKLQHSLRVREELEKYCSHHTAVAATNGLRTNGLQHDDMSALDRVEAAVAEVRDELIDLGHRALAHITQPHISNVSKPEFEAWGDSVESYGNIPFDNWGRTVNFRPSYTFWPRTVEGVINIVKFAKKKNLTVRCAGYRHSWSPIFGAEGQVLLTTMNPYRVSQLPDPTALPEWTEAEPTELESIEILGKSTLPVAEGNTLVRVGTACTNERLRRWCIEHEQPTLPFNAIIVELTLGGSNAPICHGAGIKTKTLSDLVRCIEYVDCNGTLQTVTDPHQLRAASGAFGLLGVVAHITLEFVPMSYAMLAPRKVDHVQAVPPPDDMMDRIPAALLKTPRTPAQRQQDIIAFEKACAENYYTEYFWFPFADQVWINTWNTTDDPSGLVKEFPEGGDIFLQWAATVMMNVAQYSTFLQDLGKLIGVEVTGTTIISRAAMFMLGDQEVKTYLPNGLHFQRVSQNVRVRDMEIEIPIPAVKSATTTEAARPDWSLARRAWWDAVLVAYNNYDTQPQTMPLEMRITGDSNVIMAPQRGNKLGTCSIEILTLENERELWGSYVQQVFDKWSSYSDADGKALKIRPHWAKEWFGLKLGDRLWRDVLKEQCAGEIKEFTDTLLEIGQQQGWTLAQIKQRFGNPWLNDFFFSSV